MPRRPIFSPTKLSCYLACPHKYYWTYESTHGQWFLKAPPYFSFGLSLHRALELFHSSRGVGVPVRESLLGALDESWLDSGYSSADEMQSARGEAKQLLENYAQDLESPPQVEDGEVLFVEKRFKKSMGEWDLVGRVDRLDRLPDGTLDIVDYKSGRTATTEEEVAQDTAMSCYAYLVSEAHPEAPVRATLYSLRGRGKTSHRFVREELQEIGFTLQELGSTIRNHHWEEKPPVPKPLCATCDFLPLCKRVPEYAEALASVQSLP